ncbi:MAG: hypothetical protein KDB21_07585, partial [Acidimicrobiales bacterium]|nr:hypothetical protein [Acidimicrobiales bacterium]
MPMPSGDPGPDVVVVEGGGLRAALVGGKGASLDRLKALGAPVPPTGVVTTAAYRRHVRASGLVTLLAELVERPPPAPEDHPAEVNRIDAAFLESALSAELVDEICGLANRVVQGAGPFRERGVAVRSSAVAEDLAAASFAGQYRSLLEVAVDPVALADAVRLTWASLWHPAPRAYRRYRRIREDDLAMAVIVMAMLAPSESG